VFFIYLMVECFLRPKGGPKKNQQKRKQRESLKGRRGGRSTLRRFQSSVLDHLLELHPKMALLDVEAVEDRSVWELEHFVVDVQDILVIHHLFVFRLVSLVFRFFLCGKTGKHQEIHLWRRALSPNYPSCPAIAFPLIGRASHGAGGIGKTHGPSHQLTC
jgi:hypothetical protein